MDSPLSEIPETVGRLRHAVWHGDWNDVASLAAALGQAPVPLSQDGLQIRRSVLLEMLSVAKAGRMELVTSLDRLRTVAKFNASEAPPTS